jgi:hypothetical protein
MPWYIKSSSCKGGQSRRKAAVVIPALILLSLILTVLPAPISAHPPSKMVLEYDTDTQTISASITHSVSDPANHYVERIEIEKNGDPYLTEDYTSQPTTSSVTYTYTVTADDGDLLEVTAYCSLFGDITEQITVSKPSPAITSPTPTIIVSTPSPSPALTPLPTAPKLPASTTTPTPDFEFVVALIGVGAALWLRER